MSSVKRLVGAAVLAVISLLGWAMPGSADAAPVLPVASYSYDGVFLAAASADVHHERGPPLSTHVAEALHAVGNGFRGTLARPGTNSHAYDADATPAKAATRRGSGMPGTLGATATTSGSGEGGDGELSSLPPSQVAAKSADEVLPGLGDVLGGLSKGRSSGVRTVGSDAQLDEVYTTLTRGGTPYDVPGYKGTWIERSDGVRIGLRDASKSGGRTIDIRYPDGTTGKVHIE